MKFPRDEVQRLDEAPILAILWCVPETGVVTRDGESIWRYIGCDVAPIAEVPMKA